MKQYTLPFLAAAGMSVLSLRCANDVLRIDQGNDTAVSPYFQDADAGVSTAALGSTNDAGRGTIVCFDATDCDDGDACTGVEQCINGYCRAGDRPSCLDGDPCTVDKCNPADGTCSFTTAADGTPCDDGNLCDGQTCSGGTCIAGPARVCAWDNNPCTVHACDPATGACVRTVLADGSSCSDGNACNGTEVCSAGSCVPGSAPVCEDRNPCTNDVCDPAAGCVNIPVLDGTSCADGDLCNGAETCRAGTCQPGPVPTCDDHNPCTTDSCASATGSCVFTPLANGSPCPDGDLCDGQSCNGGACVPGTPVACATDNDNNPCTFNACRPATGTCAPTNVSDGTPCADNNLCNGQEACSAGRCVASAGPLACADDNNPCTTSVCSPTVGCITLSLENGTSCSDGNPCNGEETCQSGLCTAGVSVVCTELRTCNRITGLCEQ